MAALLLLGALAIKYVTSSIVPGCNYAADDYHFYPIGACVTEKAGLTYSSYKYICNPAGNQVFQLEYDGSDYCDGEPVGGRKRVTGILASFECNAGPCRYMDQCKITGCVDNFDCTECVNNAGNLDNYDQHCRPFITGHCTGNAGEILVKDICENGVNTAKFYWGNDCSQENFLWDEVTTDNSCGVVYSEYYTVSCDNVARNGQRGGKAVASDIVMDNNYNNNNMNDINKYTLSLLDLILISTNIVTIMICLAVCYKYKASKNKKVYMIANENEVDDSESKSLNQL